MSTFKPIPLEKGEVRYLGYRPDLEAGLYAIRTVEGEPPIPLQDRLTKAIGQIQTHIPIPKVLLDQITEHLSTLGDETAQILEMRIKVLTGRLGLGAVLLEPIPTVQTLIDNQPKEVWAAYAGTAVGEEISLHTTRRAALEAVAETLGVQFNDPDDPQQVRADDELQEAIEDHCTSSADDWCVDQVTLP